MYENKVSSVGERSVSISQPYIRPIERYHERMGCYPERLPADKLYRKIKNLGCYKEYGIRLSGLALGRPEKDEEQNKNVIHTDAVGRIELERKFSLAKKCYGLGLIRTKLNMTTRSSIYLSIIEMNVDMLMSISLHEFLTSHYLIFGEMIL